MRRILISILALFVLPAMISDCLCISYAKYPVSYVGKRPAQNYSELRYSIRSDSYFGGRERMEEIFQRESPFKNTIRVNKKTEEGIYVEVEIDELQLSVASWIFGYISVQTLTLLPAWSTSSGYNLVYTVYKDGKQVTQHVSKVQRKALLWQPVTPFAWVNLNTPSEEEAFEACTYEFFDLKKEYFL